MSDSKNNDLSLNASWQIEAMCLALQSAARSPKTDSLPHLVLGITQRIIDLNSAWVNSLSNDDGDELADEEALDVLKQTLIGFSGGAAS